MFPSASRFSGGLVRAMANSNREEARDQYPSRYEVSPVPAARSLSSLVWLRVATESVCLLSQWASLEQLFDSRAPPRPGQTRQMGGPRLNLRSASKGCLCPPAPTASTGR